MTIAPSVPSHRSSHMNAKRSCPGVPNKYITSDSSTVMRPKSIATVVVTLASTMEASSTPADFDVIAASVVSGGISDTADTNVVLPTPNPPATTSLTEVTRRRRGAETSECPYTFDHPRKGRQFQFDRVAVRGFQATGFDQVADEHDRDTKRHAQFGGDFGDRAGIETQ